MINVSDGLSSELYHLMEASAGCGMRIERTSLPIAGDVKRLAAGADPLQWLLHGGDDFELLLTLDQNRWREAVVENLSLSQLVHVIGEVDDSRRVYMGDASGAASEIPRGGWDHFQVLALWGYST